MVMDILRRSNIEIHKVCRGEFPTLAVSQFFWFSWLRPHKDISPITGVPNSEAGVVWVAMLSKLSQDWSRLYGL